LNRALARGALLPPLRFERMFLHAQTLRFVHPASGAPMALEARLPAACGELLAALAARGGG
jgi:23S rRNA pseudouridine955/2504/2580 synthase